MLKVEELAIQSTTITSVLLALILAGCAGVTTTTPDGRETTRSRDEFEQYVKSVLRRQSSASIETGQLLDETIDNPETRLALETAERKMLLACDALNRVVHQKMEQNDPGILLEIEVKNTIGDCDFATRDLERLIGTLE